MVGVPTYRLHSFKNKLMIIKSAYADRGNIKSGCHTKNQKYKSRKIQNEQKCRNTKIQNTGIQEYKIQVSK